MEAALLRAADLELPTAYIEWSRRQDCASIC